MDARIPRVEERAAGLGAAQAFPSFLITLREGLEAALIIAILCAYLKRTDRADRFRQVWIGSAAAAAGSLAVGVAVGAGTADLSHRAQEMIEAVAGFLAVGVLTWMVFWMRKQSRQLRSELEAKVDGAIGSGSMLALPLLAFTAVGREGLETALFLYATFDTSTSPAIAGTAALAGLILAGAIGYLAYRGSRRVSLRFFFQITGGLVIFVAAGMLVGSIGALSEAGVPLVLSSTAWDTSAIASSSSPLGSILKGLFGYVPRPTVLQVIAYLAYVIPSLLAFFGLPAITRRKAAPASA